MAEVIITIVYEMRRKERMLGGTQFKNVHYKSMLSDFYTDGVGHDDDDSCEYDDYGKYTKKYKHKR